jgi:hypothetical protein
MTITPGAPWGREVTRPVDLVVVEGDASLAAALSASDGRPVAAASGDLARTLGVTPQRPLQRHRDTVNELPIDLLEVRLDDAAEPVMACAHVIARAPLSRGSWWRGPILAVMNAEFIGAWDVAPRGHPNDGRVETFEVDASLSVRQRLAARRRLRSATHVPHPQIVTRSVRTATWQFASALDVIVDGRRLGRASTLAITVVPDAAIVYA